MDEESNQERQDNELEALKAIYGEQIQEVKRKNEEEWNPLDIVISLGPQRGSLSQETHTYVDLHITCSENYPDEVPRIEVVKSKGLSRQQLESLQQDLLTKAVSLRGEVMVFELASIVQMFLHQYNKPGFKSLYDEMFNRQLKMQQKEEEQKKVLEDLTRQEVRLEIQIKKEALKQEMKWRKNSDKLREDDEDYLSRLEPPEPAVTRKPVIAADILDSGDSNDVLQNGSTTENFTPWMFSPKGVSRLENEFEVLQFLGKGAFGDVLKVRNKLDRCFYAIKRIELNPMNRLLYKKITREVKLLSRLNHENVVRYFNSWIETSNCGDSDSASGPPYHSEKAEKLDQKAVEMLPIKEVSVEWDLSKRNNSESSDDSSDDNCWITFLPGSSTTTSNGDSKKTVEEEKADNSVQESSENSKSSGVQQFMYIQMEFCEKSTLRTAIDNGLHQDEKRVWRLLREIVEGLSHIHQQGIIHRDLKPVNVFIDSEDHVKIGDFGLATTNILPKTGVEIDQSDFLPMELRQSTVGDTSHTGQVGTALYVAPELNTCLLKATYNQKVDIYSLGVMYFEMCYRPLLTHMERIKVLADLRQEQCVLPPDFVDNAKLSKTQLLRWMLSHDSQLRPTAAELLQSELLPPPQFEECEWQELLRRTINNPQSKLYKYLMASCFNQRMTTAQDVTYDMSVYRGRWFMALLQEVVDKIRKVLHSHGAVSLSPPLLVPCGAAPLPPSAVSVMARWGGVVMLPHDLRLPFARFLGHNPSVTLCKRYAIDRVYRERRVLGHHPRELYECAFDIVTPPSGSVLAESELLVFVWQVLSEFPSLLINNCLIRLNHTSLLRAIFLHCGIEANKHNRICSLLAHTKEENFNKCDLERLLSGLDLPDHSVSALYNLLDQENAFGRAAAMLQPVFRRSSLCKQAFSHLELVISNATELGVKCPIVVSPGLVDNLSHYSGMICQVDWERRNKQGRNQRTIIAAGGRYDNLVASLRQVHEGSHCQTEASQSAVGISLSIDKIVSTLQADQWKTSLVDAVLCSIGTKLVIRDKLSLARDLWAAGVKTYLLDSIQNLEEIQTFCLEMNVLHIIMLKDTDPGFVRIRSWNKDRFQEKKVAHCECVDHMLRLCQPGEVKCEPTRSNYVVNTETPVVNTVFLTGEKMSSAMKRRYESQVLNTMVNVLQRLSPKTRVEVLVVNVDAEVIKMLASYLEVDCEEQDLSTVIKRFPKHKKTIIRVSEQIQDMKCNNVNCTVVLYSITDNMYKVLL